MDFISKNKFMFSTILLLIILNIATIVTLWVQHSRARKFDMHKPHMMNFPANSLNTPRNIKQFIEKELSLTPEQSQKFEEAKEKYFKQSSAILEEIMRLKKDIIDEAFTISPDKEKVKQLTITVGAKQTEMDQLLFNHIDELKSICKPDQLDKFKRLFSEVFKNSGLPFRRTVPPQGQGKVPGRQPGDFPPPPGGGDMRLPVPEGMDPPPGMEPEGQPRKNK